MKKYYYKAIDIEKNKFKGIYLADDEKNLQEKLAEDGLYLVSCKQMKTSSPSSFFTTGGKLTAKDFSNFCRQFSMLLDSSMEIIDCLELMKKQQKNQYFKKVLDCVYEDVKEGETLSSACKKHKKIFPEYFVSMVYVGEMSSSLNKVLLSLAEYSENEAKLKSKIKGALTYPIVILILMLAVIIVMMVFAIPAFKDSMAQLDVDMPVITQTIYNISDFMTANWLYIIAGLFAFIVLYKLSLKVKSIKTVRDQIILKLPLIGVLNQHIITARLSRGLSLLLASGMKLDKSMEIAKRLIGNKYVEKEFEIVIEKVKTGTSLNKALKQTKIFSDVFIQMVAVSENTATLDIGLERSAKFFDDQADMMMASITSLIQPILMIALGVVVAVVFLAVYSPMLSMMDSIA